MKGRIVVYYVILPLLALSLLATVARASGADRLILALGAAATIGISGLRWSSEVDGDEYAGMYDETPELTSFSPESIRDLHGEPGYLLLSAVLKSAGIEFYVLVFLCAAFALGAKALIACRFAPGGSLAFLAYLCVHFVTIEFIQIRWAVASALLALAFWSQYRRRRVVAALLLASAATFHYFALAFVIPAALAELRRDRLLYAAVIVMAIAGIVLAWDWTGLPLVPEEIEGDAYIVRRALRYVSEPLASSGVLSYVRLAMVPLLYFVIRARYGPDPDDTCVDFLRRVMFGSLGLSLLVSFVPVMQFRVIVLADLFAGVLAIRLLNERVPAMPRAAALVGFVVLHGIWYVLDVAHYVAAGQLYDYGTWLRLVL